MVMGLQRNVLGCQDVVSVLFDRVGTPIEKRLVHLEIDSVPYRACKVLGPVLKDFCSSDSIPLG